MNKKSLIKFESNGGTLIPQIIIDNGFIIDVPVPEKFGYNFGGWCVDKELKEDFDPNKIIETDYVLYAKWLKYNPKQFINDMSVYTNLSNVVKDYQEIYSNNQENTENIEDLISKEKEKRVKKCEYIQKLNEEYSKYNNEYYHLFVLLNEAKKQTEKIKNKMEIKVNKKGEKKSTKIINQYNEINKKEEMVQTQFNEIVSKLDKISNDYEEFASQNR